MLKRAIWVTEDSQEFHADIQREFEESGLSAKGYTTKIFSALSELIQEANDSDTPEFVIVDMAAMSINTDTPEWLEDIAHQIRASLQDSIILIYSGMIHYCDYLLDEMQNDLDKIMIINTHLGLINWSTIYDRFIKEFYNE